MNTPINVTGLTPKQILKVQEFANRLKEESYQELPPEKPQEDEELKQLHQEFDWLVADIGIKEPITRSKIYGIESKN